MYRELELFSGKQVAADGSFVNANASKDHIYTSNRLEKQPKKLEKKIEAYLQ